jgi:hypothetical protein
MAAKDRPPARAAAGLPSIWSGETLVAVPSLSNGLTGDPRFSVEFLGIKRTAR